METILATVLIDGVAFIIAFLSMEIYFHFKK